MVWTIYVGTQGSHKDIQKFISSGIKKPKLSGDDLLKKIKGVT
jgi:hypothetical protein